MNHTAEQLQLAATVRDVTATYSNCYHYPGIYHHQAWRNNNSSAVACSHDSRVNTICNTIAVNVLRVGLVASFCACYFQFSYVV